MRVTNSMVLASTLRDLNGSLSRLQDAQTTLTTGRVVRSPSDDPTQASMAMKIRAQIRRAEQRDRNLLDARGWLGAADSALTTGLDRLGRVKELAVQASNTGALNQSARSALASEISSIRDELLALANSEYIDRPLFNGTVEGRAYDPATGAYLGNDAAVRREVAAGNVVAVNTTGEEVFGSQSAPEGDLFAVLDRLSAAIAAGDATAIAVEHDHLDAGRERIAQVVGQLGSRAARLETIEARNATELVELRGSLSQIEDADLAEALIGVKTRENAYNAALTAAAKVIPPSLVDYLR